MAVWSHASSWSKFRMALDCPAQLEYAVSGEKVTTYHPDYYSSLGKIVQYVFEQYFMQGVNLNPAGRNMKVMEKIVDKVLLSMWFRELGPITYPQGKDEAFLRAETLRHVEGGLNQFLELGLLDKKVLSEQKWNAVFRNFRMFGIIDFIYESRQDTVDLLDGKGNVKKNADPRQLLYYALMLHASGKKIRRAGFLYWQHDFEEVDCSPKALKDFVDGDFERGRVIMEQLKTGVSNLPTNPSNKNCYFCSWRGMCPDSAVRGDLPNFNQPELVSLS